MKSLERVLYIGLTTASLGLGVYALSESQKPDPLINRVFRLEVETEKTLGYLCHESNQRYPNLRKMTIEDCRQFRNDAYDMARAVPSPTPLPEILRQATQVAAQRRGGN